MMIMINSFYDNDDNDDNDSVQERMQQFSLQPNVASRASFQTVVGVPSLKAINKCALAWVSFSTLSLG